MADIKPPDVNRHTAPAPEPASPRPETSRPAERADVERLQKLLGERREGKEGKEAKEGKDGATLRDTLTELAVGRREGRRERGDGERDGGGSGQEQQTPSLPVFLQPAPSQADRILAGLDGASSARPAPAEIDRLVDKMVERVLVSERTDNSVELHMTIKDGALNGTEISITRTDGALAIQIIPAAAAVDFLADKADMLAQTLTQRLNENVAVAITPQSGASTSDRQQNQRSQGYDDILRYMADRKD